MSKKKTMIISILNQEKKNPTFLIFLLIKIITNIIYDDLNKQTNKYIQTKRNNTNNNALIYFV